MISIIVPIYNVEKYVRECIESLVSQDENDLEIILVDDGSTDSSGKICDEYAVRDSRIRVVHKPNGGLVSARQAGLDEANGDYVGFVDGDDTAEPRHIRAFAEICEKYSPDVVVSEFYSDFGTGQKVSEQNFSEGLYNKERLTKEIYPTMLYSGAFYRFGILPNCWSKLFKKELLQKHLPTVDRRIKMGEDTAFTYACLLDAQSVYFTKQPTYRYRILPSSMSRGYDKGLESIIFLPYDALKKANNASRFDISNQLAYYHIYLANFAIRNEAKASRKDKNFAKRLICNSDLQNSVSSVKASGLPTHTRFIVNALRKKNALALNIYIRLMGLYLK